MTSSCCGSQKNDNNDNEDNTNHCHSPKSGFHIDWILHGSISVILISLALAYFNVPIPHLHDFTHSIIDFLKTVWWGLLMGMLFVGIMNKIPKEYYDHLLGSGEKTSGIFRAAIAGVVLDLCSHGILMVAAKFYERGVSLAQVMTFLIASPWNSLSLTIILIALIGLKWTSIYILGSLVIAIVTGLIVQRMTKSGALPQNPNSLSAEEKQEKAKNFKFFEQAWKDLKSIKLTPRFFIEIIKGSKHELNMLLKWLLLGVILASAIRAFVPAEVFQQFFGPSLIGLLLTLVATTIIEICSEGSAPIASEIVNGANAPGNGFAFLMAGVATDYTEIMVLKETTKSWKMALVLPMLTVPQTILLGYIFNIAGM